MSDSFSFVFLIGLGKIEMKIVLLLIILLVKTGYASPVPVTHSHDGRVHSHILPNNGVGKHNHKGKSSKKRNKVKNSRDSEKKVVEIVDFIREHIRKGHNGDANAQLIVASHFWAMRKRGKIVEEAAMDWFKKSANNGNDLAQLQLGAIYIVGKGRVEKNRKKGLYWIEKSAKKGNIEAKKALAMLQSKVDRVSKQQQSCKTQGILSITGFGVKNSYFKISPPNSVNIRNNKLILLESSAVSREIYTFGKRCIRGNYNFEYLSKSYRHRGSFYIDGKNSIYNILVSDNNMGAPYIRIEGWGK